MEMHVRLGAMKDGTIRGIGPNILVCAPHNVNVDAEAELYGMDRG